MLMALTDFMELTTECAVGMKKDTHATEGPK